MSIKLSPARIHKDELHEADTQWNRIRGWTFQQDPDDPDYYLYVYDGENAMMDPLTYVDNAIRTEGDPFAAIARLLYGPTLPEGWELAMPSTAEGVFLARLLHSAQGLMTESGEFMDVVKRAMQYGKPVDKINLLEELGDQCWYIAIALHALGSSFPEIMARNIDKLRVRFPDKFSTANALQRNLGAERRALGESWGARNPGGNSQGIPLDEKLDTDEGEGFLLPPDAGDLDEYPTEKNLDPL